MSRVFEAGKQYICREAPQPGHGHPSFAPNMRDAIGVPMTVASRSWSPGDGFPTATLNRVDGGDAGRGYSWHIDWMEEYVPEETTVERKFDVSKLYICRAVPASMDENPIFVGGMRDLIGVPLRVYRIDTDNCAGLCAVDNPDGTRYSWNIKWVEEYNEPPAELTKFIVGEIYICNQEPIDQTQEPVWVTEMENCLHKPLRCTVTKSFSGIPCGFFSNGYWYNLNWMEKYGSKSSPRVKEAVKVSDLFDFNFTPK
tara:strand:- start:133957 stop:134721 length:765 start_codon:yes stop_codon:yes gene_type:complete